MESHLLRRRFWQAVSLREETDGFSIVLDARPLMTPAKAPLRVPTQPLAEAIAAEWAAVEAEIRPETMPLTRAANATIDKVAPEPSHLVEGLAAYGEADLICYRADAPEALRERQAAAWDPLIDWAEAALGARLEPVTGIMPRPQPPESLAALRDVMVRLDPFRLTALSELVTLSGSLVIGLAVSRGVLSGKEGWERSRVDETWQIEQWGADAEAMARTAIRRSEFLGAENLLRLLEAAEASTAGRASGE